MARVAIPTAAGRASRKVAQPQSSKAEYSVLSPSTFAFDRLGSKMVPRATPSMAQVGNSISRSAYDSQEMLPSARREAMLVLIIKLIWAAETANTAGPIFFST